MYSYIKGFIGSIDAMHIVVENNNIGYKIRTANPFSFIKGETLKIYIYQHVREDMIEFFGFKLQEEMDLFTKLISAKGVGPKTALGILATGDPRGVIEAIETGNASYLQKFPGIGPKASQQIVLDLRGKLTKDQNDFVLNDKTKDLQDALEALGYKKKEIIKTLGKIDQSNNLDVMIKESLKMMLK